MDNLISGWLGLAFCSQDSLGADGVDLGDASMVVAGVDVDFGDIGGGIGDIGVDVGAAVSDGSMIFDDLYFRC